MTFESVYLRTPRGERYGPLTMDDVQKWVREGRVPLHSVIVDDETGESRYVEDIPEVAPLFKIRLGELTLPYNRRALTGIIFGIASLLLMWPYILPGSFLGLIAIGYSIGGLLTANRYQLIGGRKLSIVGILLGLFTTLMGLVFMADFIVRYLE